MLEKTTFVLCSLMPLVLSKMCQPITNYLPLWNLRFLNEETSIWRKIKTPQCYEFDFQSSMSTSTISQNNILTCRLNTFFPSCTILIEWIESRGSHHL